MIRKEQIKDAAKHEDSDGYFGFIAGAEWADANPHDSIAELIHQRSIAFDEAKKFQTQLVIATEVLKKYVKTTIGASAAHALREIEKMKDDIDE